MKALVIAALLGGSLPAAAADISLDARQARADYGALAPKAQVYTADCGEQNAEFLPSYDVIVVCNEMAPESDAVLRFVIAHEMAHAIMFERDIASYDEEDAADELAALVLEDADDRDAVVGIADWFMRQTHDAPKGDEHSANLVRAHAALCIDDGVDGDDAADPACALYVERARAAWVRLLLTVMR